MYTLFVLSLAVLGATAAPCNTGCGVAVNTVNTINGINGINGISGVSGINAINNINSNCLPGPTFVGQTPVVQNPTSVVPGYVPTTSVSQSCHCLKTAVRPQLRTEIISVPQVDRIVRIVPSPVVEAVSVNVGGNTRQTNLPTCGINTGSVDGFSGVVGVNSGVVGVNSGLVGVNSGLVGVNSGVVGGIVGGAYEGVSGVVGSYPVVSQGVVSGAYPVVSGFNGVANTGLVGCGY